ncbi:DUF6255 family natural product biosynthesis protein [Streptomyces sp. ET3-23]|uniref:DUF6255 family natural product biosynthesis protein n=1 Tax=Streptomyces sp. ET3-23 TaxID=2885643 RepID=UPI0022351F35|nr:DUF6255 family natural product biosynthesis protein [Streptomyces sp. ET3-23]
MVNCQHNAAWRRANGVSQCTRCGARRFTDYGALRPDGLPQPARTRRQLLVERDKAAALIIAKGHYRVSHWGFSRADSAPKAEPAFS